VVHAVKGAAYLITGGASLIGSHIADVLLAQGAGEIRLFDNFSLGTPETIQHLTDDPRIKLIRGDILRLNELIDAMKGVDGVFALAGFLTLPMSQNPLLGISVNTIGMVNTLEACRLAGVRRIIFSSSVSTYGNSAADPMVEETPFAAAGLTPASQLYGSTKLLGEAICAQYSKMYGVQYNALRFSSVYGERQHWRAVNAVFIAETCEKVRKGERPVIVGDGTEVHDYLYVTDVAEACLAAMISDSHGHVMNICTGIDTTLTEVVNTVLDAYGRKDLKPDYQEDRRTVKSSALAKLNFSPKKATKEIGWTAKITADAGIRRYIAWRNAQG